MNNYNKALEITSEMDLFLNPYIKRGDINSKDLLKITEYAEKIILPTLQAKQVFNTDPEAAVGCRFLIPIEKGWTISVLVAYIAETDNFDADSFLIHDSIGLPVGDTVKSGWVEEEYKSNRFKIRK